MIDGRLTIDGRVEAGGSYLDGTDTDHERWIDRVDIDRLDVEHPCLCIFGQLFGGYAPAVAAFGLTAAETEALGFHAYAEGRESVIEYRLLTEAWRRLIKRRRAT